MSDETFDFRKMLKVPPSERLRHEKHLLDDEMARFGRNVAKLVATERFVTACQIAMLRSGGHAPDMARRIRLFLQTGTIAS
jgi:hypothetical protein